MYVFPLYDGMLPYDISVLLEWLLFWSALFFNGRGRIHSTRLTATPSLSKHCLSGTLMQWLVGPLLLQQHELFIRACE